MGALAPQITYEINHHASVRLAHLSKEAGVRRFLYASTCSVYGSAGEDLVTEDAPLRPLTPYAQSKVRVYRTCCGWASLLLTRQKACCVS